MAKMKGLGKGLDALLGDDFTNEPEVKSSLFLPISQVESCAAQPRKQRNTLFHGYFNIVIGNTVRFKKELCRLKGKIFLSAYKTAINLYSAKLGLFYGDGIIKVNGMHY